MVAIDAIVGLLGAAMLGVFGWAVQINSRVAILETQFESLKELINSKFDETNRRLGRIEQAMNGTLGDHHDKS